MTYLELTLALLALLLTPGPTNTLIFLAGSEAGWRHLARLIPAELAAYLAVILPLALLSQALAAPMTAARPVVAVLAGLWVLSLAIRLWRPDPAQAGSASVTAARVAVTTALNPKGLIMGVVLLPAAGATPQAFALLAACILGVALLWGGAGVFLTLSGQAAPRIGLLRRAAAVWLMGLSVFLVAGGLGTA